MPLMTDEAVETEQFTHFQGGTAVHRLHIGQGLLCLQMALSAMSFVDNVKDVEHVADNATRFLVLEDKPLGLIKSFCHLNLEVSDIIISTGVTFAEFSDFMSYWVIKGGFF